MEEESVMGGIIEGEENEGLCGGGIFRSGKWREEGIGE